MSEIFLDYDTRTRKSKYVTIRAFSAARWICLTFLVIQLPVTVCLNWTHESFSLSLDFITDGSLDWYSVFTVDNFENVDEKASKKRRVSWHEIDEPTAIEEWTFVSTYRSVVNRFRFHESVRANRRPVRVWTRVHEWEEQDVVVFERSRFLGNEWRAIEIMGR